MRCCKQSYHKIQEAVANISITEKKGKESKSVKSYLWYRYQGHFQIKLPSFKTNPFFSECTYYWLQHFFSSYSYLSEFILRIKHEVMS